MSGLLLVSKQGSDSFEECEVTFETSTKVLQVTEKDEFGNKVSTFSISLEVSPSPSSSDSSKDEQSKPQLLVSSDKEFAIIVPEHSSEPPKEDKEKNSTAPPGKYVFKGTNGSDISEWTCVLEMYITPIKDAPIDEKQENSQESKDTKDCSDPPSGASPPMKAQETQIKSPLAMSEDDSEDDSGSGEEFNGNFNFATSSMLKLNWGSSPSSSGLNKDATASAGAEGEKKEAKTVEDQSNLSVDGQTLKFFSIDGEIDSGGMALSGLDSKGLSSLMLESSGIDEYLCGLNPASLGSLSLQTDEHSGSGCSTPDLFSLPASPSVLSPVVVIPPNWNHDQHPATTTLTPTTTTAQPIQSQQSLSSPTGGSTTPRSDSSPTKSNSQTELRKWHSVMVPKEQRHIRQFSSRMSRIMDTHPVEEPPKPSVQSASPAIDLKAKLDLFETPLPVNIIMEIFNKLGPCDLARASCVNRNWDAVCSHPTLWISFAMELGIRIPDVKMKRDGTISGSCGGKRSVCLPKNAVGIFRRRCLKLSRSQLLEAVYKPMLLKCLREKDGSGFCGWLSVRGENLFMKWKRRWAAIWDNCLVIYRSHKPQERPLMLIPLRGDVQVDLVKRNVFKLSSIDGVLWSLTMNKPSSPDQDPLTSASSQQQRVIEEEGRGYLYLSADKDELATKWIQTISRNVILSKQLFGMPPRSALLKTPLFGVPLTEIMAKQREMLAPSSDDAPREEDKHDVPLFLDMIIAYIREKALDEEGLFRISGNTESVINLRYRLESGAIINFDHEEIHTLTAVIKMFLRELPVPLVPQELNSFINATLNNQDGSDCAEADESVLDAVRMCLDDLPPDNIALLKCLTLFFNDIVAHSEKNKMNQNNLFIVFIPTLRVAPSLLSLAMAHPDELFGAKKS